MQEHESFARLLRFREVLREQNYTATYLRNEPCIQWLSVFDGVFDNEGAFSVTVTPNTACIHTDSRYQLATERAAKNSAFTANFDVVSHARCAASVLASDPACVSAAAVLAVEDSLTLREYKQLNNEIDTKRTELHALTVEPTTDLILSLRAVKDAWEIQRLRASQAITDAAFAHIVDFVKPGMTEREVQQELEHFMLSHGAQELAFSSIVATGENGASPHAIPADTVLEAGQCVVLDFGAKKDAYCSDMTRMLFLGEPSQRMRSAYAALVEANETVEAALRPGVSGKEMHNLALSVLEKCGFGGLMGHGLGHGVGLEIHELPNLSPANEQALQAGNVVTVEPGIYIPGEFGMRLEDFGVLTDTGFDIFTQSSHNMVII